MMIGRYTRNKYNYTRLLRGGGDRSIAGPIRTLYESFINFFKNIIDNTPSQSYGISTYDADGVKHRTTYGEITFESMQKLMSVVNYFGARAFIDVGCGQGKFPIVAAADKTIYRASGIELVPDRYQIAIKYLEELNDAYPSITSKINFLNENMLNIDFRELSGDHLTAVWISNLCFEQSITGQLFDALIGHMGSGTLIMCSALPWQKDHTPDPRLRAVECENELIKISDGKADVRMTWGMSTVYFYRVV